MAPRRLVLLVAVAGALAACGGSGYEYVANRREGVYFKVPDDWRVFDNDDLLEPEEAGGGVWVRGFDAAADPDPERVFAIQSATPRGFAEVRPLSQSERQAVSLTSLRAVGFGTDGQGSPIDPLLYAEQNPEELRIHGYDEIVLDGARGVRLQASIAGQGGPGADDVRFDQTVLVDDATSKRFRFTIGCTQACWDAHGDEIEEVIDSWTLEATS